MTHPPVSPVAVADTEPAAEVTRSSRISASGCVMMRVLQPEPPAVKNLVVTPAATTRLDEEADIVTDAVPPWPPRDPARWKLVTPEYSAARTSTYRAARVNATVMVLAPDAMPDA